MTRPTRLRIALIIVLIVIGCSLFHYVLFIRPMTTMVRNLHAAYPAATLQDVYKTCYQDFFGAEHAVPDSASAAAWLTYELSAASSDTMLMPLIEPCGWRHQYERVSLETILRGERTEQELLSAFLNACPSSRPSAGRWANEWRQIQNIAIREVPEWKNDTLQADLREAARLGAAVHHSRIFHNTYHPHYRIIKR